MKKLLLLTVLCFAYALQAYAQQKAMFTQYMFNGLAINPAYSALDEAMNITLLARQQWVGFKGAPNTQTLAFHTPIKESNSSIGLLFLRDQIGEVITDNGVYLSFAQKVQLTDETYLAVGANGGLSKYSAEYSRIESTAIGTDPVFNNQNDMRGNFGLGVMLFSKDFYLGVSSPFFFYRALNGSFKTSSAYKSHYMIQGGLLKDLGPDLKFKPNVLIKYVNGSPWEVDLNANFLIKDFLWLGASYRSFDSVDGMIQVQLNPNIQVGYSYDFTTTELKSYQTGTHEIALTFRFPIRGRNFPRCYY